MGLWGVVMYWLAFGLMRRLWGRWYGEESRQEEVCSSGVQGVGDERIGPVRVAFQERKGRNSEGEQEGG